MTSSTANLNKEKDAMKMDDTEMEAIMLNYLLLPTLCAIFLILIVLFVAFCLIKKKSSSTGDAGREKSCHTIDSFNEVSDISIYDVINEVHGECDTTPNAEWHHVCDNVQPSPQNLLHTKSRCLYSLASCLGTEEKTSRRSVVLKSVTTLSKAEFSPVDLNATGRIIRAELAPRHGDVGESSANRLHLPFENDDRIYETLDRRWTREMLLTGHPIGQAPESRHITEGEVSGVGVDGGHNLSGTIKPPYGDAPAWPSTPRSCDATCISETNGSSNECEGEAIDKPIPCVNHQDERQTICKISFLPVTDISSCSSSRSQPIRSRNFYYILQNNDDIELGSNGDDCSSFQSSSSVCLHFSSTANDKKRLRDDRGKTKTHSLNMKPLSNSALIQLVEDASSAASSTEKLGISKRGDVSYSFGESKSKQTAKSLCYKKVLLKKSESFSETASKRPDENVRKFSLGAISFKQHAKNSEGKDYEKMDKEEVARILSKLGPLPPVPLPPCDDGKSFQQASRVGNSSGFGAKGNNHEIDCTTANERNRGKGSNQQYFDVHDSNADTVTCVHENELSVQLVGTSIRDCDASKINNETLYGMDTTGNNNHYFILETGSDFNGRNNNTRLYCDNNS